MPARLPASDEIDCLNAPYVERLLDEYLRDPSRVPAAWRAWFDGFVARDGNGRAGLRAGGRPSFQAASIFHPPAGSDGAVRQRTAALVLQHRVEQLVWAYRSSGHLRAQLDPLGMAREQAPDLSPSGFGIDGSDLDETVYFAGPEGPAAIRVRELVERLESTYCRHVGIQVMHIEDAHARRWLIERIEHPSGQTLTSQEQRRILRRLTEAVVFEEFVRKKYVGAKTFSLEGSETLMPLLDLAIERAAAHGVEEIVIGMPHRGRLNVLANIIGQPPRELFAQFDDENPERYMGGGDVKYHLGASGDRRTSTGDPIHLSLCFNPSHLEFVNPVALGRVRAKQDRWGDAARRRGMALLIHGDAGVAGEGIVQESLNLSQLEGYATGGTLHVIVNNQLGFTTQPAEGRSGHYPSDVARMLQIPILHVNGEYPEAVAEVVDLAMDFRREFQRDVVIDLYCFRRFGHNEADEPAFTHPLMYQAIEHHPSTRESYLEHLLALGGLSADEAEAMAEEHREYLQEQYKQRKRTHEGPPQAPSGVWEGCIGGPDPSASQSDDDVQETDVRREQLAALLLKLAATPDDFHLHRKLRRSVEQRRAMAAGERPLDWSAAEALALATLAVEGHRVRLSGQDSVRGTFSQRHAVLHDVVDGHRHGIFSNLAEGQAPVEIINSPLSEAGVLGFDYGFSLDYPEALVAWEAQFGDFANAAQVIIDQFIASAEDKWLRLSGLVMLLPHGFEGQGPEHSSARLERFLMLSAQDNIQVVYPTTPAQYFSVLRRQVKRRWKKPLVVLTPKSLLRHRRAVSSLEELAAGRFRRILADEREEPHQTSRILLCSGKVYYELAAYREENQHDDAAILRVEQLYPLADEFLREALCDYAEKIPVVWVQEEPENMGAWPYWRRRFGSRLLKTRPLTVVARPLSASPATGSKAAHKIEQRRLIKHAFGENDK